MTHPCPRTHKKKKNEEPGRKKEEKELPCLSSKLRTKQLVFPDNVAVKKMKISVRIEPNHSKLVCKQRT